MEAGKRVKKLYKLFDRSQSSEISVRFGNRSLITVRSGSKGVSSGGKGLRAGSEKWPSMRSLRLIDRYWKGVGASQHHRKNFLLSQWSIQMRLSSINYFKLWDDIPSSCCRFRFHDQPLDGGFPKGINRYHDWKETRMHFKRHQSDSMRSKYLLELMTKMKRRDNQKGFSEFVKSSVVFNFSTFLAPWITRNQLRKERKIRQEQGQEKKVVKLYRDAPIYAASCTNKNKATKQKKIHLIDSSGSAPRKPEIIQFVLKKLQAGQLGPSSFACFAAPKSIYEFELEFP